MLGHKALAAEIGNLILPEAAAPQSLHRGKIHIRLGIVVRQVQGVLDLGEGSSVLDFQGIAADVLRI